MPDQRDSSFRPLAILLHVVLVALNAVAAGLSGDYLRRYLTDGLWLAHQEDTNPMFHTDAALYVTIAIAILVGAWVGLCISFGNLSRLLSRI